LVWIAYRLLNPAEDGGEHGPASTTFWGAMKTIIIADAVMGLDNVLAVAGASNGSYVLVVLGLLISIPIVIWGSTQILKLVERFPSIIYLGAGVLAWTAAKMIISEPMAKDWLASQNAALEYIIQVVVVLGVLFAGYLKSRSVLQNSGAHVGKKN
jgi:predicted tellurium resistance membrane protein TerC